MHKRFTAKTRKGALLSLFVLGLIAALIALPYQFSSEAGSKGSLKQGLFERTESHQDGIDWYDIREDKNDDAVQAVLGFRQTAGRQASTIADVREKFVQGENELRTQVPSLKIEYNTDIRIPEVIATDGWKSKIDFLTRPSEQDRAEILRNFVKQNDGLIGVNNRQAESLKVVANYTNPNGDLSYAHLEQQINGIPVFRGEIKAGFTRSGEMVRAINNLAPGLDYASLSTDFSDPLDAVRAAAGHINYELTKPDMTRNEATSTNLKTVFGTGDFATTAEKMYFPTEPGVAVPSWRVLIWEPNRAFYVIVDAQNGTMLWRKNITDDQTQTATYQVYTNSNAMINVADSPAPLTPGPIVIGGNAQGTLLTRSSITRIGNEPPYTFDNNGWITDGANITDGNNVEAGVDRVAPTGVDAPQPGDSACPGAGCRIFTSAWNPPPGSPAPGDDPLTPVAQRGAVIQMFYVMNRYHDEMYLLGFTEAARNFQAVNFSGMGLGNDRVSAEGQDSSGTNNANFSTPADGGRGVMQMYLWTGPTPDKDGTTDADVIIHEVTHGTSNRLHGNGSGLGGMGGMMGEGWSDWYAHVLLSEPTDPQNGIYTTGGYATHLLGGFTDNYYYGIRRWPKALLAFTGGPARPGCGDAPCPHNPFTFKHINSNCDTTLGTTTTPIISAFPRSPVIATSGSCNQVHNAGEIWSSALWEVRDRFITRLGWAVGNRKTIQLVTDGMKLAPLNPTFLQERDAIIAAAAASSAAPEASVDVGDVREGFRRRGMGFSASVQSTAAVTEAFDFPNARLATLGFSVSDSTGDNDGAPEPGEPVLLSVPVINPNTGGTINNVQATVTGGGSANYGNIADGATVTMPITYTVPAGAVCGSMHNVTITVSSAIGSQTPEIRSFRLGIPIGGAPVTFTSSTAMVIPGTGTGPGVSAPYGTTIAASGLSGNKNIKLELTGLSHTFPGDLDILLVGPGGQKFVVMSDAANTADAVNVNTLLSDGAPAIIPSADSPIAGDWRPTQYTSGDAFTAPAPAGPYLDPATAGSQTFTTAFGSAGAAMNGTWTLYVMDDAGVDVGEMDGWKLTFEANDYACSFAAVTESRADFDGDGKTDLSVFRPSEGNWYLNRSTAGFGVLTWGIASDTLVPGDYDGDGKADTAVFRPSNTAGVTDFYILNSNGFTYTGAEWGVVGDSPVNGDFDGDNKADVAVFRPSSGTWYILNSGGVPANTVEPFGLTGDIPVSMDSDNDGKTNLAVYRPSNHTFYVAKNSGSPATNFDAFPFGQTGDYLVPGDYDNDNKTDIAVYRPSTGQWIIRRSSDGSTTFTSFGISSDIPVPGDYDGDGTDDLAVYRSGTWYIIRSTSGFLIQAFGLGTDKTIPGAYIPANPVP
jgi:subtilisin-like proprotein convertase family protein